MIGYKILVLKRIEENNKLSTQSGLAVNRVDTTREDAPVFDKRLVLTSMFTVDVWYGLKMEAICLYDRNKHRGVNVIPPRIDARDSIPRGHHAPHEMCRCGVHVWRSRKHAISDASIYPAEDQYQRLLDMVPVKVEISGKVIPYQKGYRVERARIVHAFALGVNGQEHSEVAHILGEIGVPTCPEGEEWAS